MLTHTTQAHYSKTQEWKKKKYVLQRRTGALLIKMRNEQNWVTHIMECWEYNITLVEDLIKWRAWPSRCSSLRRLIYHLHSVDYSRVWVYFKHIT